MERQDLNVKIICFSFLEQVFGTGGFMQGYGEQTVHCEMYGSWFTQSFHLNYSSMKSGFLLYLFFTFFLYLLPWPDAVKFKYRQLSIHSKGLLKEITDRGKLYSSSSPLLRADLDCLITSPIFFTFRNLPSKPCFPIYTSREWKLPFYFLIFFWYFFNKKS